MHKVTLFYNPFLPEMRVTLDGHALSSYSSIFTEKHRRVREWCNEIFVQLGREINSDYSLTCVSVPFVCRWMEAAAEKIPECISFKSENLPFSENVFERLERLENLGCECMPDNIQVPVFNCSSDGSMVKELFKLLKETGFFIGEDDGKLLLEDIPLVRTEIKEYWRGQAVSENIPIIMAVLESEKDNVYIKSNVPIYAFVMSSQTRFIKAEGNILMFNIDPDELGDVLLDVLSEEVYSPTLSKMSCGYLKDSENFLNGSERAMLEMLVQASPACSFDLPSIIECGEKVPLKVKVYPKEYSDKIIVWSEDQDVLAVEKPWILSKSPGKTKICACFGEKSSPVSEASIIVKNRILVKAIRIEQDTVCIPVHTEYCIPFDFIPDNAENLEELKWTSSNTFVVSVASDGTVHALNPGRSRIEVSIGDLKAETEVCVQPIIQKLFTDTDSLSLSVGESKPWRYRVFPINAYKSEEITVSVSDPSVAQYRNGYIIGKSCGTCRISAGIPDGSMKCEVLVNVKKGRFW